MTSVRIFSYYTATTFNLVITAYLHYSDNYTMAKLKTMLSNCLMFGMLVWATRCSHTLVVEVRHRQRSTVCRFIFLLAPYGSHKHSFLREVLCPYTPAASDTVRPSPFKAEGTFWVKEW